MNKKETIAYAQIEMEQTFTRNIILNIANSQLQALNKLKSLKNGSDVSNE